MRAEFDRKHEGRFAWVQRQLGDGRWEVQIVRTLDFASSSAIAAGLRRSLIFTQVPSAALQDLSHYVRRAAITRHHCVVAEQGVLWPYVGIVASGIVQAQLITTVGRDQAMYGLPGEVLQEPRFSTIFTLAVLGHATGWSVALAL